MEKQEYITSLRNLLINEHESENNIESACKYAENLIDLDLPVIFNKEHFSLLIGRDVSDINKMMALLETHYYVKKYINKKSGGKREIGIPAVSLRKVQRWILDNILSNMHVSDYAMGFCKHKSIVTNAQQHVGMKCIVNLDLKDFFPSITQKQVFNIFYYYGYTVGVSYMLSRLCTCEGRLPQGAPTSPCISNIVCLKLDKRLSELSKKYNANYSRYADDITFSANSDITSIIPIVNLIVIDEGFTLNEKKTRVLFDYQKQEVTGLLVSGNCVRVDKKYIKKIKQEIYYCKKYGVDNHLNHINCHFRFYRDHLYGKVYFVKMVDPELGNRLLKELEEINWEWSDTLMENDNGTL